jgi:hypothetical protein
MTTGQKQRRRQEQNAGGLSTARRTVKLSAASVEMTASSLRGIGGRVKAKARELRVLLPTHRDETLR